jgi:dTDP-4-dehydrorhamnose 3,5-epimerase
MNGTSQRFSVERTALHGVAVVSRRRIEDSRGFFSRFFCADELRSSGWSGPVAQINHTLTRRRGTVRGLHYQMRPHAEDKLVSVLRGEVFDVAVDLRAGSPTFLQWHGETLSTANGRSLLIPAGCAHGFQTLDENTELLYLHSVPYAPGAEGGVHPLDPAVDVAWPLPPDGLSARDASFPFLDPAFQGVP